MKTLGKATLLVAGAGYGLIRGFRLVEAPRRPYRLDEFEARLDELENRYIRVSKNPPPSSSGPPTGFVTHEELAATIETAAARIRTDVERRFETQSLAIGSLRSMISQTDVLLQKVLRGLETSRHDAHPVASPADTESLLSH